MTMPAPHRGRIFLLVTSALAALLAAAMPAGAQQPGAEAAAQSAAAAPKKAPAKAAAKPAAEKTDSASYSVGVSMGEQLRASGVTAEMIDTAQLASGVRDAISGKASLTDKDRDNIRGLVSSVGEVNHRTAAKFLAENGKKPDVVTTSSGLQYKIVSAGSGDSPKGGDEVTVNYRGTLISGTEFDSSYRRGQSATFPVNGVIRGWTEALLLMKPGAKWQLFVPPQLAYDLQSRPPIPPGSLLIFDVELLSVKAGASAAAQPAAPAPSTAPTQAAGKPPATQPPPK